MASEMDYVMEAIQTQIDDVSAFIHSFGMNPELYFPDIGVGENEAEAYAVPYLQQYLAGLQIFASMFNTNGAKVWGHLMAEMQAGKTGVVCVVIRLLLKNIKQIGIRPENVFLITGMSDNSWREQTRLRVPASFRSNVQHSGDLKRVHKKLNEMRKEGYLKNCMVIIDESHIAAKVINRPSKEIFNTMCNLCPTDQWESNNVRVLTISATDPAAILAMLGQEHLTECFRLVTTSAYQSVESLYNEGRLIETFKVKDDASLQLLLETLFEYFGTEPLYHIVRPQNAKNQWIRSALPRLFRTFFQTECDVIPWDSTSPRPLKPESDASSSLSNDDRYINDINTLLVNAPVRPTFIIIKDMFNASKTLDDTHVGVMYERCAEKDDTTLQRLLGRECGYGKSKRTIVFTSVRTTVMNYIEYWKDMNTRNITMAEAQKLAGRMSGVIANEKNGTAVLGVGAGRAVPIGDVPSDNSPKLDRASKYEITEPFPSRESAKARIDSIKANGAVSYYTLTGSANSSMGYTISYRGNNIQIHLYETHEQFKALDIYSGVNESIMCRIMPVMYHDVVQWVCIYLKSAVRAMPIIDTSVSATAAVSRKGKPPVASAVVRKGKPPVASAKASATVVVRKGKPPVAPRVAM
jgi:hypothetical protein